MMSQLLGWGVALIVIGLALGLLAITGVVVAAFLPWVAGVLLIVGIIMAIASAARPPERREARV
jgi:hypothetical protein